MTTTTRTWLAPPVKRVRANKLAEAGPRATPVRRATLVKGVPRPVPPEKAEPRLGPRDDRAPPARLGKVAPKRELPLRVALPKPAVPARREPCPAGRSPRTVPVTVPILSTVRTKSSSAWTARRWVRTARWMVGVRTAGSWNGPRPAGISPILASATRTGSATAISPAMTPTRQRRIWPTQPASSGRSTAPPTGACVTRMRPTMAAPCASRTAPARPAMTRTATATETPCASAKTGIFSRSTVGWTSVAWSVRLPTVSWPPSPRDATKRRPRGAAMMTRRCVAWAIPSPVRTAPPSGCPAQRPTAWRAAEHRIAPPPAPPAIPVPRGGAHRRPRRTVSGRWRCTSWATTTWPMPPSVI